MEAPCNGGAVNLEGLKQRPRGACVRRAQRITPSRAREKKGQNGGVYQKAGIRLMGGCSKTHGWLGGVPLCLLAPSRDETGEWHSRG
jgi:hypothetical protein